MAEFQTNHLVYGDWLRGQIKSLVDQAHQRKGEAPAAHSADVHTALADLEKVLAKLQRYEK